MQDQSVQNTSPRVIKMPVVSEITGYQRTTIYNKINPTTAQYDPKFPKPIRLGARSIGWIESEVQAWVDSRIKLSRANG